MTADKTEQDQREKLEAWIKLELLHNERWRTDVEPAEADIRTSMEGVLAFARLTLSSLFLLNGGALVALPAFASLVGLATRNERLLMGALGLFVLGLIATLVAMLAGYFAQFDESRRLVAVREIRAIDVNHINPGRQSPVPEEQMKSEEEYKSYRAKQVGEASEHLKGFFRWRCVAIVCVWVALAAFIAGASVGAIYMTSGTPAVSVKSAAASRTWAGRLVASSSPIHERQEKPRHE